MRFYIVNETKTLQRQLNNSINHEVPSNKPVHQTRKPIKKLVQHFLVAPGKLNLPRTRQRGKSPGVGYSSAIQYSAGQIFGPGTELVSQCIFGRSWDQSPLAATKLANSLSQLYQ